MQEKGGMKERKWAESGSSVPLLNKPRTDLEHEVTKTEKERKGVEWRRCGSSGEKKTWGNNQKGEREKEGEISGKRERQGFKEALGNWANRFFYPLFLSFIHTLLYTLASVLNGLCSIVTLPLFSSHWSQYLQNDNKQGNNFDGKLININSLSWKPIFHTVLPSICWLYLVKYEDLWCVRANLYVWAAGAAAYIKN